jgi:hypothetical protein
LASRLGEDVAKRDEILLTEDAFQALEQADAWQLESRTLSASGVDMTYYALTP